MILIVRLAAALVMGFLVISCGGAIEEEHSRSHSPADQTPEAARESAGVPGLHLNGTDKWPMDDHTRTLFSRMNATFEAGVESSDRKSIQAAGKKIRGEIDELIQGCTMTGEAHDQLHAFLIEYIPAVERMARDGNQTDAERVHALLELYPTYFQ